MITIFNWNNMIIVHMITNITDIRIYDKRFRSLKLKIL